MNTTTHMASANHERRRARISGYITVAGAVAMLLPWMLNLDGMDGGYALALLGLFVALSAGGVALTFHARARRVDALFAGNSLLAHWTCTGDAWQAFVEQEFAEKKAGGRSGVILIAAIALPLGGLFWLFDREAGLFVFLTMVALVLLILLVAWGAPLLWRQKQRTSGGDVWLSATSAYYQGVLFRWTGMTDELANVTIESAIEGSPAVLHLPTRSLQTTGWVPYELRLPLPDSMVNEAEGWVELLRQHIA